MGISLVWPIFKASIPGLNICNIDSWSEFNFGKKVKKKHWYCFARNFMAVAARGKVALIHVSTKVCLFSGLRNICLYNLIEGKFILDRVFPGEFLEKHHWSTSNCGYWRTKTYQYGQLSYVIRYTWL